MTLDWVDLVVSLLDMGFIWFFSTAAKSAARLPMGADKNRLMHFDMLIGADPFLNEIRFRHSSTMRPRIGW